jgi:hypothetical protein
MPAPGILGGAQIFGGILQSVIGGGQARSAQRQMENMVNNYQGSTSIKDFYTKALNRYNADPTASAMYRTQNQAAQQGLATGINAYQDRRSAMAGIPKLIQSYNNQNLKAAAAAEQQQSQDLQQLGMATQLKDREDKYKFENKYNLLGMKAGGGNQIMNAGLGNIFGGLGSISDYYTAKEINKK